jgi:hypothetical protein
VSGFSGRQILAVVTTVVVAAAVATGIVLMGPPSEERMRRLDERRVEDLQQMSRSVYLYNTRHQRLPVSLTELSAEPGLTLQSRDPVTGDTYGYSTLDAARYELCAIFDRESTEKRAEIFWSHGSGRHCFVLKADQAR